ncbi:MAG TPA: hypothetical protein VJZ27_13605, partial [Aggregatilineales bacterium]|nr:hypothetical protein [Aggregatilineales bacterium]
AQTGLPSVIGWANHMRQQFTHQGDEVEKRRSDIQTLYTTGDMDEIRRIIREYDIQYIVLSDLERAFATEETIALFTEMVENGELSLAYNGLQTQLFKVENLQVAES